MSLPTLLAHRLAERPQQCQWLIDQLWGDEAVGIVGGEPKVCLCRARYKQDLVEEPLPSG